MKTTTFKWLAPTLLAILPLAVAAPSVSAKTMAHGKMMRHSKTMKHGKMPMKHGKAMKPYRGKTPGAAVGGGAGMHHNTVGGPM